jgi:hypothetical protein
MATLQGLKPKKYSCFACMKSHPTLLERKACINRAAVAARAMAAQREQINDEIQDVDFSD